MARNGFIEMGYDNQEDQVEDTTSTEDVTNDNSNEGSQNLEEGEENVQEGFFSKNENAYNELDNQKDDEPDYDSYSPTALIALSEIKEGVIDIDESEIPADLDAKGLRDLYRSYSEKLSNKHKESLNEEYKEYSSYIERIKNGAQEEEVKASITLQNFIEADVTDQEAAKNIIHTELAMKGVDPSDIEAIVEKLIISGEYKDRALKSQEFFKQKDAEIEETIKQRRIQEQEAQEQRALEVKNQINAFIQKDTINGIPMNEIRRQEFNDAINNADQIVKYTDQQGNPQQTKMSKAQKLIYEFQNNVDMQLEFVHFMLNKNSIENTYKTQRNNELLDMANRVSSTNNYKNTRNAFEQIKN